MDGCFSLEADMNNPRILVVIALAAAFMKSSVSGQVVQGNGQPGIEPPLRPPDVERVLLLRKLDLARDLLAPHPGLTLDMAVTRLLADNLDLRAMRAEIPMARADIES